MVNLVNNKRYQKRLLRLNLLYIQTKTYRPMQTYLLDYFAYLLKTYILKNCHLFSFLLLFELNLI